MIDRFVTDEMAVIMSAAKALVTGSVFETVVDRSNAQPKVQHWRGYVVSLNKFADSVQIEMNNL